MILGIKGEYTVKLIMQNMFNTYELTMKEHNIVTDAGVELIFKCATNTNGEEYFGDIYVGENDTDPHTTDTIDIFINPVPISQQTTPIIEDNTITYDIVCDGGLLDGTCEIGVWSNTTETLISRSKHDTYSIPSSTLINLKYTFTIKNIEETTEEND